MPTERPSYQNVTIESVDTAINDWLDLTVDAHVPDPNGQRKKVPVLFASGERWIAGRTRLAIRDKNGVIILPVISLRRTGIDFDRNMSAISPAAIDRLQFGRKLDERKTSVVQSTAGSRPPGRTRSKDASVFEVFTVPAPITSVISYELTIHTQHIQQMNAVIEKLLRQLDVQKSFVAPFQNGKIVPQTGVPFELRKPIDRGYVVGFLDSTASDGGNFEEFTDQERIVKYTTQITVPAVFNLDLEGSRPAVQVERTSFELRLGIETCGRFDDPRDLDTIFEQLPPPEKIRGHGL